MSTTDSNSPELTASFVVMIPTIVINDDAMFTTRTAITEMNNTPIILLVVFEVPPFLIGGLNNPVIPII